MVSKADPAAHLLARVGLESSLKPFDGWDEAALERTAIRMFEQWAPLIERAESSAVLLWLADGSEILEWRGDLDQNVVWGSSVGFSNTQYNPYGHNVTPEMTGEPYRAEVPALNYADVQRIVRTLKRVGERLTGKPVTIGATFDAGPEFAESEFKYSRHPEIVARGEETGLGKLIQMVRANSVLNADDRPYAGYPDGIPQDTIFGEFLGRQSQSYLTAMGFDYLWMSNGFGFSSFSWTPLGETFDGSEFSPGKAPEVGETMLRFWHAFRAECDFPLEVRGTNFTAGIDIGGDGTPAREIYEAGAFRNPPPNSPWGPLNEDFGIEMSGYLSRIARLPGDGFLFRFYANDPWFWQNPWWDFYNREPFDIYLPLSAARLNEQGATQTASDVQILAIDTQAGTLDERVGREVGSHILQALESVPDEAGPLVWLYPFDEYHDDLAADPETIRHPYFEDWYLTGAINAGLPLNTVVSTRDVAAAVAAGSLAGRTIVVPTRTLTDDVVALLPALLASGCRVLAYGALHRASPAARDRLGLAETSGIDGDLALVEQLAGDSVLSGALPTVLRHVSSLSSGPVTEVVDPEAGVEALATVERGGEERVYASLRAHGGGLLAWVRGSSTFEESPVDNHGLRNPEHLDRERYRDAASIVLGVLDRLGTHVSFARRTVTSKQAVQSMHRHDNALWISGYLADTTTQPRFRFPLGAPLLTQTECWLENGAAVYQLGKSYHAEVRVFVDQASDGMLSCREIAHFPYRTRRSIQVRGLVDGTATFAVSRGAAATARLVVNGEPVEPARDVESDLVSIANITGSATISW